MYSGVRKEDTTARKRQNEEKQTQTVLLFRIFLINSPRYIFKVVMRNTALLDSKDTTQLHFFLVANHPLVPKKAESLSVLYFLKAGKGNGENFTSGKHFLFSKHVSFIPKPFSVHTDW